MTDLRKRTTRASPFVLTALLVAAFAAANPRTSHASAVVEDLGRLDPETAISATLWLKPRDEAAFEAAIARRETAGSAEYHHWMTSDEVVAFGQAPDQIKALVGALKAAGLAVSPRGDSVAALRVSGPAHAVEAAFGTTLHNYRRNGEEFRATASDPHFTGRGGKLVAGITGLTTARMHPYLVHQQTPGSSHGVAYRAATTDPSQVFTSNCFGPKKTISLVHFAIGGAAHATLTGPRYLATGLNPAKATCGYTPEQIVTHYGLKAAYKAGYQGQGQTIVLIDAYGSPTISADVNLFSSKMGLPALTPENFSIVYPDGRPIANPYPIRVGRWRYRWMSNGRTRSHPRPGSSWSWRRATMPTNWPMPSTTPCGTISER